MSATDQGSDGARQPHLTLAELAEIAETRFGLIGDITPLSSERDQNALIATRDEGEFVLKVANASEGIDILNVQNAALRIVEGEAIGSLLPRLLASRSGRPVEFVEHAGRRHATRALTKLPGIPLSQVMRSARLRRSVGAAAAELDRAWSRLGATVQRRFPWDMTRATEARRHVALIEAREARELLARVFDEAESVTLPGLAALPAQWIHNDLNLNNLLVREVGSAELTGIIDLGDMMRAPRAIEVGIAAAHQCVEEGDPLAIAAEVVDAYGAVTPLTAVEVALVPRIMALRLAMAVTIQVAHTASAGAGHFELAAHRRFLDVISEITASGWEAAARRMAKLLRAD